MSEKQFKLSSSLQDDQARVMLAIFTHMFGFDGPDGMKLITVTKEQFESLSSHSHLSMIADTATGLITVKLEPIDEH